MDYAEGRDRHMTPKGHFRNFAKAVAIAEKLLLACPVAKEEARTDCSWEKKLPSA
jgi:hypothetical protein